MGELVQLRFLVPTDVAEPLCNFLVERFSAGIQVEDAETTPALAAGQAGVAVWVPPEKSEECMSQVRNFFNELGALDVLPADAWSVETATVVADQWVEAYKKHFKVTPVGRRLVIKPSWEAYEPTGDQVVIELDPGQAFGTGGHESTRLVLRTLDYLDWRGFTANLAADVGCGSGILAIAIAKLWAQCRVLAVDNDEVSVLATRQNAADNDVHHRIIAERRFASDLGGRFGLIVANMSLDVLTPLAPLFHQRLDTGGRLILSGLLSEQAVALCQIYTREMLFEIEYSEEEGQWRSLLLRARAA